MPGVLCKALNTLHLVAGVDVHKQLPPPPPVFGPHVVVTALFMSFPAGNDKSAPTVKAGWGKAVARQHDVGMGTLHIAPNILLPLIILGAGNKAEFGSGTVKLPTGRMGVAMIPFVGINPQLDCEDFPVPSAPTSICIASLNTVYAGFTLGDLIGGIVAAMMDSAITWAVNGIAGLISGGIGKFFAKATWGAVIKDLFSVAGNPTYYSGAKAWFAAAKAVVTSTPFLKGLVGTAGGVLVGLGIGTPLGYSPSGSLVGGHAGDWNDAVNNFFSPDPKPAAGPGHP